MTAQADDKTNTQDDKNQNDLIPTLDSLDPEALVGEHSNDDEGKKDEENKDDKSTDEEKDQDSGSDDDNSNSEDEDSDDEKNDDEDDSQDEEDSDDEDSDNDSDSDSEEEDEEKDSDDEDQEDTQPQSTAIGFDKEIVKFESAEEYIAEKLPEIVVRGYEEQDEDGNPSGEVKEFKIKTSSDLPDKFTPATYKEQNRISEALAEQIQNKTKLSEEWKSEKDKEGLATSQAKVAESFNNEVEQMQQDGDIPKIKAKEGDKAYFEDPGVKAVADIVDYMMKENKRLEKIGSPYRVQSIKQAQMLMNADKSTPKNKDADKKAKEKAEAAKRKAKGGKVGSSAKNNDGKGAGATQADGLYQPGDSLEDVASKAIDELQA